MCVPIPPHSAEECFCWSERQTERRGGGRGEQSRQAGRGGNKRECALVVSFAARLPPSTLEKPVCCLCLPKCHLETLVGIN